MYFRTTEMIHMNKKSLTAAQKIGIAAIFRNLIKTSGI